MSEYLTRASSCRYNVAMVKRKKRKRTPTPATAAWAQHKSWPYLAALAMLTLLVFSPVLQGEFLNWDDDKHVTENRLVKKFSWDNTREIFQTQINKTYIPLTLLTYTIEHRIFGFNPFVFHLNNLLLHVGLVWLLFYFGRRLGLSPPGAALAVAIFAIHPLHVESVAWITGRKDMLYGIFYVLALICYWTYLENNTWRHYIIALLCAVISILAKPLALSLPWILVLLDLLAGRRFSRRMILDKIPFLLVVEPIAWMTFHTNSRALPWTFPESPLLWLYSSVFYLRKFFWPSGLTPLYPIPRPVILATPAYWGSLLFFLAFWTTVWFNRRNRWLLFGALFYAGSTFFLWRYDLHDINFVADRFMYLPSLGLCLWAGWLWDNGWNKSGRNTFAKNSLALCFLTVGLIFAVGAWRQTHVWRTGETLWDNILRVNPDHAVAQQNRGLAYTKDDPEKALQALDRAIELAPDYDKAYYNKARTLEHMGKPGEARTTYDQAIAANPRLAIAYNNRANLYGPDEYDNALEDFDRAIALKPGYYEAYYNKANTLTKLNRNDEALELYNKALEIEPEFAKGYNNRGFLYNVVWQDYDRALEDFGKAIAIDPDMADAYNNRGTIYLQRGDLDLAMQDFDKALEIKSDYFEAIINRGRTYHAKKDYAAAATDYSAALTRQPDLLILISLRAQARQAGGDLNGALADYDHLVELIPDHGEAIYQRALIKKELGDYASALEDMTRAKELFFPVDEKIVAELEDYGRAQGPAPTF